MPEKKFSRNGYIEECDFFHNILIINELRRFVKGFPAACKMLDTLVQD